MQHERRGFNLAIVYSFCFINEIQLFPIECFQSIKITFPPKTAQFPKSIKIKWLL